MHLIGSWQNPETHWIRLIAIEPVGRAYHFRAEYRLREGRYLLAAEDLAVSIRMGREAGFPGLFNLLALRGDALAKAGKYGEAVREFSAAIALRPAPNYFYHRGVAERSLGQTREAEADLRRAGAETGPVVWQRYE